MFSNIGSKIKTFAFVCSYLGICLSLMVGVVSLCINSNPLTGILIIVFGSLVSWVGSFMTYGFGQLIENTDKLAAAADTKKN